MPLKDSHCSSTTRTDVNSRFLWINMTNSLRKKSYSENTEFNCWLVVIVFPYDDPLSVQETTIANRGNIFGNYFSLYLSICRLTTVLYINAFSFAKLTETFVHKKRLKLFAQANAERCTEWFAFWRLLSNPAGGLKFLISWKVWFSLGMPRLICIPFHHIIWFRNPLSWRAFLLKFAALTRKCRKRASVWCGKLYQ